MTRWSTPVRTLPPTLEWALWTDLWPRARPDAGMVVLPLLPRRHRWAQLLSRVRDVTVVLMLIGVAMAAVLDRGLPGRLGGALVLGALLAHVLATGAGLLTVVDVRADRTGAWIRLANVHPGFVEATEAATTRPTTTPVLAAVGHDPTVVDDHRPVAEWDPDTLGE